jgi:hypothetical protein
MNSNAFFQFLAEDRQPSEIPSGARQEGAWRVLPLEGTFEIVYEDSQGIWSHRVLEARELKLGPGRTLLGGIDRVRGGYRGFRADRIRRLMEVSGRDRLEAGILDWLLARAESQRRERAALARPAGRNRRSRQVAADGDGSGQIAPVRKLDAAA